MVLTSYQSEEAYRGLLAGTYRPETAKSHIKMGDEYARAYEWMMAQMVRRIGPKPAGATLPYWAWMFRKNALIESYDRSFAGKVKLTLDIDESRLLMSSCDDWDNVINGTPVLLLEEWSDDDDEREEVMRKYRSAPQQTWERIFDMKNYPERFTWAFQVTFWELRPSDIVAVSYT